MSTPLVLPSRAEPHGLASRGRVDAATALLYRAVVDSPRHREFIARVRALAASPRRASPPARVKLAVAPAAFYRENPRSGADGRVMREAAARLGWDNALIPAASTGSIAHNARAICEWLSAQDPDRRIVLVSVCKGGSDVKLALKEPQAKRAFARVECWINLCGILDGTPLAPWMLSFQAEALFSRLYYRMKGVRVDFVSDLRREAGAPLDCPLELPEHMKLISVVGFPLRAHITSGMARRCHDRLSKHGPNDGVVLLNDVCAQPGWIYPVWGADHFLRSGAEMPGLPQAILDFVAEELAR